MVDSAGGRSQLAQLTTAAIVLVVLLFFTKPLQYMPNAVLASVVFLIGVELVDIPGMMGIARARLDEFVIAAATALTVVVVGVEQAVVLAIIMSIIDHLRRSYHPNDTVLVANPPGAPKEEPYTTREQVLPGLVVYRFGASLYYANTARFTEELRGLVGVTDGAVEWLCIDATAIGDVDYSGERTLHELIGEMQDRSVRLVMAGVTDTVRAELDRDGISELLGDGAYFESVGDVLDAFGSRTDTHG
jgi:sulfate permease, SulP family